MCAEVAAEAGGPASIRFGGVVTMSNFLASSAAGRFGSNNHSRLGAIRSPASS
jgi:hypothetical protein